MRARGSIDFIDLRRRQHDGAIEDLPLGNGRHCQAGEQHAMRQAHFAYPSSKRPTEKTATPSTIITSMVLTLKPAPVDAREPLVTCIIMATGRMTNPITCSSFPNVRITVYCT